MPAFIPVHPPRTPDDCAPWLYEAITRLNRAATSSFQASAAVVRGEVPDSSGNPLPAPDLSGYFLLAGRSGGQIAKGDTVASGILTLVSTANATKGKIYFGSAQTQAAFDEAQGFFGFGTVAPSALVDVVGSGSMVRLGATGVTHTVNGTSGDMKLTSTDAGFIASGGTAQVTAGMLVSGTNVAPNTYVRHVNSNTDLSLTVALTGDIAGGTVTFTDVGLFRRTNDETGTDIDFFLNGALRITAGTAAPLRVLSDQLDDSNVGLVIASCSAVNGTRTLTAPGTPFGNVLDNAGAATNGYASGDIVTGSGIPVGTYVVTKVTNGQLTLSNTLPTITTQTMTFKRQTAFSIFEAGTVVSGNAVGAHLQFGGPNRGELSSITIATNKGWIRRQSAAGSTQIGWGFGANPQDYTTAWTGLYMLENLSIGEGASFLVSAASSGTAPNKALGGTYLKVDGSNGRIYMAAASSTQGVYHLGNNDAWSVTQQSNDLQLIQVSRVAAWSDSLNIANSFRLLVGDLNGGHRALFLASSGNGTMTRFGISSTFTLITSAQAGSSDFLAPEGATSVLRVHNAASGLNSAVIMRLSTAKAVGVQAGDMLNILDSTSYVMTSVTPAGLLASTTGDVFWEDDKISFEDENVYYSVIH
jgi:hypothetical protein